MLTEKRHKVLSTLYTYTHQCYKNECNCAQTEIKHAKTTAELATEGRAGGELPFLSFLRVLWYTVPGGLSGTVEQTAPKPWRLCQGACVFAVLWTESEEIESVIWRSSFTTAGPRACPFSGASFPSIDIMQGHSSSLALIHKSSCVPCRLASL